MSHQPSNTLQRSLACLASPITLLAIAVLLLNDHFLKSAVPSWLTGKLSDFAGLYFFPFVVTAFFGILFGRSLQTSSRTGAIAFTLTAVWFTLMKTAAPITTFTETAWAQLIGAPVQIIPDPTDLIALLVLIPAWKLWQRPPRRTRHTTHPLIGWAALCLASLASLATSCESIPLIIRLTVIDDVVYAGAEGYDVYFAQYNVVMREWTSVSDPPPNAVDELTAPPTLPITACVPQEPQICYQITGDEKVYSSQDGGQTWQTAWEVPLGRRYFMERYLDNLLIGGGCKGTVVMGPYDLVIVPAGPSYRVVVAMGNEGALVFGPEGEWLRQDVFGASPTPFWVLSLSRGFTILFLEELAFGLVAFLTLFVLVGIATRSLKPVILPFLITIFVGGFLAFLAFNLFYSVAGALFIIVMMAIATLVYYWRQAQPSPSNKALTFWLFTSLALFVLAITPFWLWLFGLIPIYQWALLLSVLLVIFLLWFAGRHLLRLSKTPT